MNAFFGVNVCVWWGGGGGGGGGGRGYGIHFVSAVVNQQCVKM